MYQREGPPFPGALSFLFQWTRRRLLRGQGVHLLLLEEAQDLDPAEPPELRQPPCLVALLDDAPDGLVVYVAVRADEGLVVGDGDVLDVRDEVPAFLLGVTIHDDADQLHVRRS